MSKRRRATSYGADGPIPNGREGAPGRSTTPGGSTSPRRPATRLTSGRERPPGGLRRWILPGFLAAAALATVGILYVAATSTPPVAVKEQRPVLGQAGAPVVIREYGDFQCPSCGAFFRSIEPQIRAAYIDPGKVRLEWHDFAWIGAESRDAANAARCAGDQGRFWDYHDLLYRNQGGENVGAFSKDRLKSFGASLGLDAATFNACVDGGYHQGAVQADFADVSAQGFNGTPTFVIGNQRIVGAQPFAVFQAAIDAALAAR